MVHAAGAMLIPGLRRVRSTRDDDVMKRLTVASIFVAALGAAGCESTKNPFDPPKPLDKMTQEEWCSYYAFYLTNPGLSQQTRTIATTQMHKRGCPNVG